VGCLIGVAAIVARDVLILWPDGHRRQENDHHSEMFSHSLSTSASI
jgi:hypothetical protein